MGTRRQSRSQPQPQQNGRQPEPQHPPPQTDPDNRPVPDDVFGWDDDIGIKNAPPLAVAGRVFCMIDWFISEAIDRGESATWLTCGLAELAKQADRTGDWNPLGTLLTGLETLVDANYRKEWPLLELTVPPFKLTVRPWGEPQESENAGPEEEEEPAVREQAL